HERTASCAEAQRHSTGRTSAHALNPTSANRHRRMVRRMSHHNILPADETSVSTSPDRPTPRRDFIGQITASAIVLATGACAQPAAAGQSAVAAAPTPAPGPRQAATQQAVQWDDSWFGRLTAKHKA